MRRPLAMRSAAFALLLVAAAPAAAGAQTAARPGQTPPATVRDSAAPVRLRALDVSARKRLPLTGRFRPMRAADSASVRAEGGRGAIAVRGIFARPGLCQELGAAADRTGHVVTVVVEARDAAGRCLLSARAFRYTVTLHALPADTFTVRVFQAWRNRPGERQMVLDTTLAVR